jgi:8-amino-7-oxononanoate synthase
MLSQSKHKQMLVLTDTVFSMDGDIAPLKEIAAISARHAALFCVDDAHALGVLGEGGRGALEEFKLSQTDVPVMVGTFGKALGCFGAFAAGTDPIIEFLVQKARPFIYTTALPATICAAVEAALGLLREEAWRREQLFDRINYLRTCARDVCLPLGDSRTPIQPLIVGSAANACALSEGLYSDGIFVAAIRPPTVPLGTSRLRITLSSSHSREHIDRLIAALLRQRKFWQR